MEIPLMHVYGDHRLKPNSIHFRQIFGCQIDKSIE